MKLLLSIVLTLAAALGCGVAGAAGGEPARLNIYLYSAAGGTVELFAVDFTMPEGKRHEPIELFQEARAQCKRLGFVTARRTEVQPAVLKVHDREVSGSLLRYSCANNL